MIIVSRLHVKDCLGMAQTAANCKVSTGTTATQPQVVRSCGKVGFVWPAALFREKRKPSLSLTVWERNLLSFKILTLFFFKDNTGQTKHLPTPDARACTLSQRPRFASLSSGGVCKHPDAWSQSEMGKMGGLWMEKEQWRKMNTVFETELCLNATSIIHLVFIWGKESNLHSQDGFLSKQTLRRRLGAGVLSGRALRSTTREDCGKQDWAEGEVKPWHRYTRRP